MVAFDTNVLLRVFLSDDELQHAAAKRQLAAIAKSGKQIFVAVPVLCEMVWVLTVRHALERAATAALLDKIVESDLFVVDHITQVRLALTRYRASKGGFSDYLIAELAAHKSAAPVFTFDKALLKERGFAKP